MTPKQWIGTVLLAVCVAIRKQYRKYGSISAALHHFAEPTYVKKEYRKRAAEYSVGIFFAVALTMVDGVVSFSTFLSNILTSGCSNLCAIAKGNGDYERARKLFSMGLFSMESCLPLTLRMTGLLTMCSCHVTAV